MASWARCPNHSRPARLRPPSKHDAAKALPRCRHTDMMARHLVAILHSLPSGGGKPTIRRVDLARQALGCTSSSIANIFPAKLAGVRDMSVPGAEAIWHLGRIQIEGEVARHDTSDVLLGYGVSEPGGVLRSQFREQMAWLESLLIASGHRVWTFGGRPTHPSRWQRVVFRERPGRAIEQVVADLLTPVPPAWHPFSRHALDRTAPTGMSRPVDTMNRRP